MEIREAVEADLPAIVALLADDQLGSEREASHGPLPQEYLDAFRAINTDPNNLLVVAEADRAVVGTLQVTFIPNFTHRGGRRAQIEGVRVGSTQRGQGIGRRLLEWAIQEAELRGCRLVQLTTDKRREGTEAFYLGLGFDASHTGMKLHLGADTN